MIRPGRRLLFVTPLAASAAFSGCAQDAEAPVGAPSEATLATAAAALVPATEGEVCPGTHRVGRLASANASCPDPLSSSWSAKKLFGPGAPGGLGAYCLYERQGSGTGDGGLPSYQGKPPHQWLDVDCMAVAPLGTGQTALEVVRPNLESAFLTQLGAPPNPPPNGSQDVLVAVIDSQPNGQAHPGQLRHGLAMGALIETVACGSYGGAGCSTSVVHRLALNLEGANQVNEAEGGYAGYLHRLATSIVDAVDLWQQSAPTSRLVINLSIGWDAAFGERTDGSLKHSARAVRDALQYARCQGALIFAAAGNKTGDPTLSDALYPARWEQAPAACIPGRPLVYAVGGVDHRDLPLRKSIDGGQPSLVAPSFAAMTTASVQGVDRAVGPYTGTSVGAAAASGAAALAWSLDGNLSADEVYDVVRGSGVDLSEAADFCAVPPCSIHRIDACEAAEQASGASLGCNTVAPGAGQNPDVTPQLDKLLMLAQETFDGKDLVVSYQPAVCTGDIMVGTAGSMAPDEALLCVDEHLPLTFLAPVVEPQPPDDPCGLCLFAVTGTEALINVAVDGAYSGSAHAQTLTLWQGATQVETIDIGSARMNGNGAPLRDGLRANDDVEVRAVLAGGLQYGVDFDGATIEWTQSSARTHVVSELVFAEGP